MGTSVCLCAIHNPAQINGAGHPPSTLDSILCSSCKNTASCRKATEEKLPVEEDIEVNV